MFHVRGEILAARGTRQDVRGAQVHQAILAKRVPTLKNPGYLIFIVIVIVANGASYIHFSPLILSTKWCASELSLSLNLKMKNI